MFVHETKVKVRYAETDQMGVVYHGNYAEYYEIGRTECIEACSGISYATMESEGIILPVIDLQSKFIRSAKYNQILTVKSIVTELPTVRLKIEYEIYNEDNQLINTGRTTLVFVDKRTEKPCAPPENFMKNIRQYFEG